MISAIIAIARRPSCAGLICSQIRPSAKGVFTGSTTISFAPFRLALQNVFRRAGALSRSFFPQIRMQRALAVSGQRQSCRTRWCRQIAATKAHRPLPMQLGEPNAFISRLASVPGTRPIRRPPFRAATPPTARRTPFCTGGNCRADGVQRLVPGSLAEGAVGLFDERTGEPVGRVKNIGAFSCLGQPRCGSSGNLYLRTVFDHLPFSVSTSTGQQAEHRRRSCAFSSAFSSGSGRFFFSGAPGCNSCEWIRNGWLCVRRVHQTCPSSSQPTPAANSGLHFQATVGLVAAFLRVRPRTLPAQPVLLRPRLPTRNKDRKAETRAPCRRVTRFISPEMFERQRNFVPTD